VVVPAKEHVVALPLNSVAMCVWKRLFASTYAERFRLWVSEVTVVWSEVLGHSTQQGHRKVLFFGKSKPNCNSKVLLFLVIHTGNKLYSIREGLF